MADRAWLPAILAALLVAGGAGSAAAGPGAPAPRPEDPAARKPVSWSAGPLRVEQGAQFQEITYTSDGLRVKGLLFLPRLAGRAPGIVFNHGGVRGISPDMIRRSADLARAGYVVLTPAYRGEGGSEGRVEVAAGEVTDVLNAAGILRRHPRVDPERLALVGSSHGALVSVLAAARDARFRAVAAACGVMDVAAWYRWLVENHFDVSDSLSLAVYGHGPEDRPAAFRARSAVLAAPVLRPPLLIQQGLSDRTVPPEQAWRMMAALDRAGHRDHRLLTYPLLGHAFWFWNDPNSHTAPELAQADASWDDLLDFLAGHLEPAPAAAAGSGPPVSPGSAATAPAPAAAPPGQLTYEEEILASRREREERLRADNGWLTVAGLFWLEPGDNPFGTAVDNRIILPEGSAPPHAGSFILTGDRVEVAVAPGVPVTCEGRAVTRMALTSDAAGRPEVLVLNDLRMFLIKRARGHAIRMRDLNAPARRAFTGIECFPVDTTWRVEARFIPYTPPKPLEIPSIIGTVDTMQCPGAVEFMLEGRTCRLDPILEDPDAGELFFIFKDETSGFETYPPGRFLYSGLPVNGRLVLDFNRAYNPPCAFTDFATCPLPPPQNALPIRVTAGEKRYGHH